MTDFQVHVCDPFTGFRVDGFSVSGFSWEQLLSARGNADITVPLTKDQDNDFLRPYLEPWQHIIVLERDGVPKFGGYPIPGSYTRGKSSVSFTLGDFWALLGRRIMTAPGAANVEKWSTSITGPRAKHAADLIQMSWDRVVTPSPKFPLTIPGGWTGTSVTRTYYGYEMAYLHDKISSLMDEGLDVFFAPEWESVNRFGWRMRAGDAWGTGTVREFTVSASGTEVMGFRERVDGSRVTNNADRVGEGSEVDLLVRSNSNPASTLPLLERITMAKTVSSVNQLAALATGDLETYGSPTVQWDFDLTADSVVNVGDTVRLLFDGDLWIPDGIYSRRVVKISGDMTEKITVSVQPTGGA